MKRTIALILAILVIILLLGYIYQNRDKLYPTEPPAEPTVSAPAEGTDSPSTAPQTPAKTQFSLTDAKEDLSLGGVKVTITKPVVTLGSADASDAVNQYFNLLAGKVRDYAEGDVAAMATDYAVTATYKLTYESETAVSFAWIVDTHTETEAPNFSSQTTASFDKNTGKLLTFDGIFGANTATAKNLFLQAAKTAVEAALKEDAYYFDQWQGALETEFSKERFYLCQQGIVVFYPRESLGTLTEALVTWDNLAPYLAAKL
jgi:hypothetical protein